MIFFRIYFKFLPKRQSKSESINSLLGILAVFLLISCTENKTKDYNQNFQTKYGEEIKKISQERANEMNSLPQISTPQSFKQSPEDLLKENSEQYYPYVDIAKLGDNPRENFGPNGEIYQQIQSNNNGSLPQDMFVISYNTTNHPQYSYSSSEFDNISVPVQDAYGVKTELLQKPYLMAGNDSLQRSVDHLQKRLNAENINLSKTLIAEAKAKNRQKKMEAVFGEDDLENSKKLLVAEENTKKLAKKDEKESTKIASNITILDPATLKKVENSSPSKN